MQVGFVDDPVDVEERFDAALELGHAGDVMGRHGAAEVRRRLDFGARDGEDLLDCVDDDTDPFFAMIGVYDVDHDDAGGVGRGVATETEFGWQVDDGDDLSPQVDDSSDFGRHPGHGDDGWWPDDFPDFQDSQSVGFRSHSESQVFFSRGTLGIYRGLWLGFL